ncbi:MFS transporter [Egicoccus halophilus]|uniref:MFS transporter n=1 Tax=Egicoccus halophilus TaxID=1670830 RepID=A0A8J3A5Q9_9ACTN|nr:MFS transporter [Egicoccus halophilus]GGI03367.1 MFS transporter [Egicoccus halophilus]
MDDDRRRTRARQLGWLAGTAVFVTALNLRPAASSFGALLPALRQDIGMPSALAGVVTSLPPVCFGVFGLLVGRWARRRDTALVLVAAMLVTSVSLLARVLVDDPLLVLWWTVPALGGMGVGNVLLPVAVKRWFPRHVGRATGLYSMALALGTAAAAAASVPVAEAFGSWRVGLGVWALPPLFAVPVWLLARRRSADDAPGGRVPSRAGSAGAAAVDAPDDPVRDEGAGARWSPAAARVHRHPRAWALAGYFGLQSLAAYVVMGWLPSIYQDAGVDPTTAGLLLAWVMVLGAPVSVVMPELAARREDQRVFVVGLSLLALAALVGLLLVPTVLPALWATLLGIGMGAFPLALVLIGLRARSAEGTARLSALSQGVGYLIAAGGPFAIGLLHDATGSWTPPLLVLIGLQLPQLLLGLVVARPGTVD